MIVIIDCYPYISIELKISNLEYMDWRTYNCNLKYDIDYILRLLLKSMDCTIMYDCGRPLTTVSFRYTTLMTDYYRYLLYIDNPFLFNQYVDKLVERHIANIEFERNYTVPKPVKVKKKAVVDKYIREETKDLFTNETIYIYTNYKTNDIVKSNNPDLLDVLNTKKTKEKKTKVTPVSLDNMTFSFKRKE